MTGVAELYLFLRRPHSRDARKRLFSVFRRKRYDMQRFVVLSWKRTGSNLFCGILHNHPEIIMHNELFNQIDIHTYHPHSLLRDEGDEEVKWNYLARDLWPELFLDHIWSGRLQLNNQKIKPEGKAVGFKSFADHWTDAANDNVFQEILEDHRVKKIVLKREDELAVYVSMMRAEITGIYMGNPYPSDLRAHIDPSKFQIFINNYRRTFEQKYRGPFRNRDTFHVTYEQLIDEQYFDNSIAPLLWDFLGVSHSEVKRLAGVNRQSKAHESLVNVISNYPELEYAFRHTDVTHFASQHPMSTPTIQGFVAAEDESPQSEDSNEVCTWSVLLPICSRLATEFVIPAANQENTQATNRFSHLERMAQHNASSQDSEVTCWKRLTQFAISFKDTVTDERQLKTEIVVGIDVDDSVFHTGESKERIAKLFEPSKCKFVDIHAPMYGKVCRIWSRLGQNAENNFLVLLGDDLALLDQGWQEQVEESFQQICKSTSLPHGVGCVALNDTSFPGFPTFPVIHREHLNCFQRLLPQPFVNQGGDPFLFELYSRWNAASFVSARLTNTLGGDSSARYIKHDINWPGQVLTLQVRHMQKHLKKRPHGICLDVVVPSYRINNDSILEAILNLRASKKAYIKFWIVVDNPSDQHVADVQNLAKMINARSGILAQSESKAHGKFNYFVNVVHYGDNRGASHARNVGYNYSTKTGARKINSNKSARALTRRFISIPLDERQGGFEILIAQICCCWFSLRQS